jgi:hypothetical protein
MLMTGYIHNMIDNKLNFKDFVYSCARAFTPLILMREDPLNAPIPDKFDHDEYHSKELDKVRKKYKMLSSMDSQEQLAYGKKTKAKLVKIYEESLALAEDNFKKVSAMLKKVENWKPPSKDHEPLKAYMINQLNESRDIKYEREALVGVEIRSEQSFYDADLDISKRDIKYHTEKRIEEIERTTARNLWIKLLKESVENEC